MKSAFERFFSIGQVANEFVDALGACVAVREGQDAPQRPLAGVWGGRWSAKSRLLDAWASEFCAVRGQSAHGQDRSGGKFVWSAEAHLAFASMLFPLLVKQRIAKVEPMPQDERSAVELAMIEDYLCCDRMAPASNESRVSHPWAVVYSEKVSGECLRRTLEREWDRQNQAPPTEPGERSQ